MERRAHKRSRASFIPVYFEDHGLVAFGVLRNSSDDGACLHSSKHIPPIGARICYATAMSKRRLAQVVWVSDEGFGVKHLTSSQDSCGASIHPYRSVRVPLRGRAVIKVEASSLSAELINISTKGACLKSSINVESDSKVLIEVAGAQLGKATVRWVQSGIFGVEFNNALDRIRLSAIIDDLQLTYQRRHYHLGEAA